MSDIAIAHKDYAVAGGGEIVAERLGKCLDAPVYTGFLNDDNRSDIGADVRDLFGNGLAGYLIRRGGLSRQLLYRYLWKHPPALYEYDVVIQSGMEPLWFQPRDIQTTIAYVHSTPRMQYDLAPYLNQRDGTGLTSFLGHVLQKMYNDYVRGNFIATKHYPDHWIANSELVARRLERYWRIDPDRIDVVYPPVPVDHISPENAEHDGEYYLSVNRLDDWKRIDTIIDAFKQTEYELRIAGKGPAKPDLEAQAADADNIEFLGYVDSEEKAQLLAEAKATVYNPLNEDFGMVPIESVASGTPVISVNDGFQRFQVTDGQQAIKYDRVIGNSDATARHLEAAVHRFERDGVAWDADEMASWATQFAVDRFEREMQTVVERVRDRTAISTEVND